MELTISDFAPVTNLSCEHHFGDLDSSQKRQPNASYHHHSSIQMIKRNRRQMMTWLGSKGPTERSNLMKAGQHIRGARP
ncbi:hypothetical protein DPMN_159935 [Dreissena polymorpha]|uniref:Uncharacterized protein n=1 Tax=Dreissena polymorpha TaxID=45954 RepID=A0A9D4EMB5_DREPO|nr:hypothetical protein DPMN_159935 [Dreissena polymorpha]